MEMKGINAFRSFLGLLPFVLSVASYAEGPVLQQSAKEYVDTILDAKIYGAQEAVDILGLLFAILAIAISFLGVGLYNVLKRRLNRVILEDIREAEIRSLISLGIINYNLFSDQNHEKPVRLSAINSAVAHTKHALNTARNNLTSNNKNKISLTALSATNLAYFYVELSGLEATPDAIDATLAKAEEAIDCCGVEIDAAIRVEEMKNASWYNIEESRLYVRYKATKEVAVRQKLLQRIDELVEDHRLPSSWRDDIKNSWDELRATTP